MIAHSSLAWQQPCNTFLVPSELDIQFSSVYSISTGKRRKQVSIFCHSMSTRPRLLASRASRGEFLRRRTRRDSFLLVAASPILKVGNTAPTLETGNAPSTKWLDEKEVWSIHLLRCFLDLCNPILVLSAPLCHLTSELTSKKSSVGQNVCDDRKLILSRWC